MPEQHTQFFKVILCQITDNRQIDRILGEALRVFSEFKRCQPVCDVFHARPAAFDPGFRRLPHAAILTRRRRSQGKDSVYRDEVVCSQVT